MEADTGISIHALLAESDLNRTASRITKQHLFLSTLSLRRATIQNAGARLHILISIHALLAESDTHPITIFVSIIEFLSTLSLRRATSAGVNSMLTLIHFYPRSPCGERPVNFQSETRKSHFYPRSPCGERRAPRFAPAASRRNFYPRSPCGERQGISSSRAEAANFYPRSPCGERPFQAARNMQREIVFLSTLSLRRATLLTQSMVAILILFLSTLSLRRATIVGGSGNNAISISIHALLAESDSMIHTLKCCASTFLSTLSLRRATAKVHKTVGHFCAYETNFMEIASSC